MPLKIYDSIEPAGNFKVTGAKNVWTEDGKSVEKEIENLKSQFGGIETVFAEQEVGGFINTGGYYSGAFDTVFPLVEGETYIVDFDGKKYEYEAYNAGMGVIAVGEMESYDPFVLMYAPEGVTNEGKATNGIWTVSTFESHTIGVYKKANYATEEFVKNYVAENGEEIPVFDLAALGLDTISITGDTKTLETDTTEIVEAFGKGPIEIIIPVGIGGYATNATLVMNPAGAIGNYQSISLINLTEPAMVTLDVSDGMIIVSIFSLKEAASDKNAVVASVDLSAYESGTITETYPDGSVIIYSFEFDSEGNPTKMTDSSGNETTFIW